VSILDTKKVNELYCRQPNDPVICGDKVCLPDKSDPEWCEVISVRYKGKLGERVDTTKEKDYFHLKSDKTVEDRRCIEVKSYPRKAEGKKPALKLDENMIRKPEPNIKNSLEDFLRKVIRLGEGKKTSVWGIMKAVRSGGYDIWVAGGAVRDLLRGESPKDSDLAGTVPIGVFSEIVGRIIGQLGLALGSNSDGSVWHIFDPYDFRKQKFRILEYAPLKLSFGYVHEEECRWEYDHDLTKDAVWRDLTINCLFYDVFNDLIFDPTGDGWNDLQINSVPNLRVILPLPLEPKGEAAKKLLRLLKFTRRYPEADKNLAHSFIKEHLSVCTQDFQKLTPHHRKIRIVAHAFYGSGRLGKQDELRKECVNMGIDHIYQEFFEPLWKELK